MVAPHQRVLPAPMLGLPCPSHITFLQPPISTLYFWEQSLSVPRQTSSCHYPGSWLGLPLALKFHLCDHIWQYTQDSGCLFHSGIAARCTLNGSGREEREPWSGATGSAVKRPFPAPSVEQSSLASTHVRRFTTTYNSSFKRPNALLWPQWALHSNA